MSAKNQKKKTAGIIIAVLIGLIMLIAAGLGIRRCVRFIRFGDTKFHSVSSVEELYAMESSKSYRLTCDLDLSGQEWKMLKVNNFDGNGHTISNAVVAKAMIEDDRWGYTGFFSYANSISNVAFKNISVTGVVTCESTNSAIVCGGGLKSAKNVSVIDSSLNVVISASNNPSGRIGGVSGGDGRCTFEKCTVKNCTITVQQANKSNQWLFLGGITGAVAAYDISDCVVENTDITCQSRSYCNFGGIVGELKPVVGTNTQVKNCVSRNNRLGLISTDNYSSRFGGIVGNIDKDSVIVENCASVNNELQVEAISTYNAGAFIGRNIGTVRNCFSAENTVTAKVNNADKGGAGYAAGFCGSNYGNLSRCVAQNCIIGGTQSKVSDGYIASGFAAYITSSVAYCGVVGGTVEGGNTYEVANNRDFIINCQTYENSSENIISDLNLDASLWSYTNKLLLNITKENLTL